MKAHTLSYKSSQITVYEHGAHLCSWVSQDREQLFLSKEANFNRGTAIRGGVPICFPQFASFGFGRKHGFARNLDWLLVEKETQRMCFSLQANSSTREQWPHDFLLNFEIALDERSLSMRLQVKNTGDTSFSFGTALHSYFRAEDVRHCQIVGLQNHRFWNNGEDFKQRECDDNAQLYVNGPIDRVYFNVEAPVQLIEGDQKREISKTGFQDIVIWNPWKQGAQTMQDMSDDEYLQMLCIEAANVDCPTALGAGETWQGSQSICLI